MARDTWGADRRILSRDTAQTAMNAAFVKSALDALAHVRTDMLPTMEVKRSCMRARKELRSLLSELVTAAKEAPDATT